MPSGSGSRFCQRCPNDDNDGKRSRTDEFMLGQAKGKGQMMLLGGCQSKPGLDELVRDCQNRNGMPNVRGEFKCEMNRDKSTLSITTTPSRSRFFASSKSLSASRST
jgi:hypothetical protein